MAAYFMQADRHLLTGSFIKWTTEREKASLSVAESYGVGPLKALTFNTTPRKARMSVSKCCCKQTFSLL